MSTLRQVSITALTAFALGVADASAGQPPQFEVRGFPISPLQMSVVRANGMQELPPIPALTRDGMPASPHQIAVIRIEQRVAHGLKTNATGHQHERD